MNLKSESMKALLKYSQADYKKCCWHGLTPYLAVLQYPDGDLISTGIHRGHAGLPVSFHVSVIKKKKVQVRNTQLRQIKRKKSPSHTRKNRYIWKFSHTDYKFICLLPKTTSQLKEKPISMTFANTRTD